MIRININGVGFLDFDPKTNISFKKKNVQFLWSNIETGRSTEFSVPATDYNRKLLGFADDTVEYGNIMRCSLDCQMQYSYGVVDCTMIVKKYDGKRFGCVLYYPMSEDLRRLNNLHLDDCRCSLAGLTWNDDNYHSADDPALPSMASAIVEYYGSYTKDGGGVRWTYMPSLSVKLYIENILNNLGIGHDLDIPTSLRIVSPTIKGASEVTGTIAKTGLEAGTIDASLQPFFEFKTDAELKWWSDFFGIGHTVDCWAIKPKVDVDITFPSDFPDDTELMYRDGNTYYWCTDRYYGTDYNTIGQMTGGGWHGEPLANRTVSLKAGRWFWFLKGGWFWYDSGYYTGWKQDKSPFSFTLKVARISNISLGETWSPVYNHPNMTVIDYLRSVALLIGKELYYDYDTKRIVIQSQDVGSTMRKTLDQVVGIDRISRNVIDWGDGTGVEIVKFDSEDYITDNLKSRYAIPNETLEGSVENVIKFSEGMNNEDGSDNVFIKDTEFSTSPPNITAKKWTIAKSGSGKTLKRVSIQNYEENGQIANLSTCLVVRVKMDLHDYMDLKRDAMFLWRGSVFVWTSINWSNGIATMTLQAI